MRTLLFALVLTAFASLIHADDYKAYWRCSDGHLEAMEAHAKWNGQNTALYVHYLVAGPTALTAAPLSLRSLVSLPVGTKSGDLIMLGSEKQWLLNCVGEVHLNPVYHHGNLIFNVVRNAYNCPLTPVECRADNSPH